MFFGKLRRSVGDSDNPTVSEAISHRILALLVTGSKTVNPSNMNCELEYVHGTEGFQLKRFKRN